MSRKSKSNKDADEFLKNLMNDRDNDFDMQVLHNAEDFEEGTTAILTLADCSVLNEKGDDLNYEVDKLENLQMTESEKRKWNKKHEKKSYNVFDDMEGKVDTLLPQYNEENQNFNRASGFHLSQPEGDAHISEADKQRSILTKLRESLPEPAVDLSHIDALSVNGIKTQSDFYTSAEYAKFNKTKKKGEKKLRKKVKTKDIIKQLEAEAKEHDSVDHGSRDHSTKVEAEADEALRALQNKQKAWNYAKQKAEESRKHIRAVTEETLREPEPAPVEEDIARLSGEDEDGNIIFDPTEEFCKHLSTTSVLIRRDDEDDNDDDSDVKDELERIKKEVKREKTSGEEDEDQKSTEGEEEAKDGGDGEAGESKKKKKKKKAPKKRLTEQEVENLPPAQRQEYLDSLPEHEQKARYTKLLQGSLLDEPKVSGGSLVEALSIIRQKGFIDRSYIGRKNDRIVDVTKDDPAPQIKLPYFDEKGQEMTQKEAYRRLSWKFHGKVPGKQKQEKMMKKEFEEAKMRQMTDVDTPLNSVAALKYQQKQTKQAHVVVQGTTDHIAAAQQAKKKDKKSSKREREAAGSESTLGLKRHKF